MIPNLLIYIGGWSFVALVLPPAESKISAIMRLISWTILWVGICWRFIS